MGDIDRNQTTTIPNGSSRDHAVPNGALPHRGPVAPNWVPTLDKPVFTPRKLKVVCVGAGFAGLMVSYKWKQEGMDEYIDLTIFEKNEDVGGTWLENRYPGVACDVPAHIYTFPFEPNPDWSSFYASGPEIWQYIKRTTKKYNLDECVQFNSKIISTIWNDVTAKWQIKVDHKGTIVDTEADILINGAGLLNKWQWPNIKGLHSFKGQLAHTARWDPELNWDGKKVAIIGNGSSAIQILPEMQPKAAKIVTYIRSPTWITANFMAQFTPEGKNFRYTEEERKKFREHPEELFKLRHTIEHEFNKFFYVLLANSPQQTAVAGIFKQRMEEALGHDPELCAKLIPDFHVGCRRLTPGDGYLEALQEPNVRIEFTPIDRVTETGIITQGPKEEEEKFDIIICATGFDVSFTPFWDLVGKDGIRLADQWRDLPAAYFGICAPNMPNYFIFNGPNCPIAHGSLLSAMDFAADYMMRWCRKIATEDIRSIVVDQAATDDYNTYSREFHKRTVWVSGCSSWFKNNKVEGPVTAMYAGSVVHYKEILERFRTEDFHIQYNSVNRFRFMGNGLTLRDEREEDLAYYVTK